MSTRIAVVREVHAFDGNGGTVDDDPLFGVVVKEPVAALHGTSGGGMNARANRTRDFQTLEVRGKERRAYGHTSLVLTLTGVARIANRQITESGG